MDKKLKDTIKEYGQALIIAFILAFIIRSFVIQAFKIPSGSMLPTLKIGDHLLVNKFIYGVHLPFTDIEIVPVSNPEFQDIVVFEYPEDQSKDFIKRVVGVPGDTIRIKDGRLIRNGKRVKEPYTKYVNDQRKQEKYPAEHWPPHKFDPRARDNLGPIEVPQEQYFVMGDNRDESYDSRFWGFVDSKDILGEAWIIYWSWHSLFDIRFSRIGDLVE